MQGLADFPASRFVGLMRWGDLSPVELAKASLDRVAQHNGTLNAVVTLNPRQANAFGLVISSPPQGTAHRDGSPHHLRWSPPDVPESWRAKGHVTAHAQPVPNTTLISLGGTLRKDTQWSRYSRVPSYCPRHFTSTPCRFGATAATWTLPAEPPQPPRPERCAAWPHSG